MAIDRKQYPANQGEARHPAGDAPGVQGCFYVAAGTDRNAAGARIGVPNAGSYLVLDAVDANGVVTSWQLFVDSSGALRIAQQTAPASTTTLAPGSVLPAIPAPNTESGGAVVGP